MEIGMVLFLGFCVSYGKTEAQTTHDGRLGKLGGCCRIRSGGGVCMAFVDTCFFGALTGGRRSVRVLLPDIYTS